MNNSSFVYTPPDCNDAIEEEMCGWLSENIKTKVNIKDITQSRWIWASFGIYTPLCIFGIIGNILTIIMFSKYIKKTTTSVFIIALAAVDLLVCTIPMPIWLYTTLNEFHMTDALCRIDKFITFLAIPLSGGILTVIAVDRFLLIFMVRTDIVTKRRAKILVAVIGLICLGVAIPQALIFTTMRPVNLEAVCNGEFYCNLKICRAESSLVFKNPGLTSKMLGKFIQYSLMVIVICFVVLYSLIFTKVYRMHRKMSTWKSSRRSTKTLATQKVHADHATFATDYPANNHAAGTTQNGKVPTITDTGPVTVHYTTKDQHDSEGAVAEEDMLMKSSTPPKLSQTEVRTHARKKKKRLPHFQTAVTLFLVTISFIVAYTPHIVIILLDVNASESEPDAHSDISNRISRNTYKYFFFNLFFLNHIVNPIIYSFMNPRFKDAIKQCCKKFMCSGS